MCATYNRQFFLKSQEFVTSMRTKISHETLIADLAGALQQRDCLSVVHCAAHKGQAGVSNDNLCALKLQNLVLKCFIISILYPADRSNFSYSIFENYENIPTKLGL